MILIKNGQVVNAEASFKADVLLDGGKIVQISPVIEAKELDPSVQIIDARGKLLMPGFIDGHTHFDIDVGVCKSVDDFASGTKAALSGGTTCIIDFATQDKGSSLRHAYEVWMDKAKGNSSCHYRFHMAIVDWNEDTAQEIALMVGLGVSSFKMYMAYDALYANDGEIFACLSAIKAAGGLLGVHCENGKLIKQLSKQLKESGHLEPSAHPLSRPAVVEAEAISRLASIAQLVGYPVMVVHLSSAEGLAMVEYWRARGVEILAETCPQYLFLQDSVYEQPDFAGAKYVISPPIRKAADNLALIDALGQNSIQTVATDHCSFSFAQHKSLGKNDFSQIPSGAPGVQHRALLVYHHLVKHGSLTLNQMVALLSSNAAQIYGLAGTKGKIAVGMDADLVLFDPEGVTQLNLANSYSHCDYHLFEEQALAGSIDKVLLMGNLVVEQGKVIQEKLGVYAHG
jgi:dihydropyrimidinase